MASFLTGCAKPLLEKSIDLIIGEAQYLCCFKCIAEDFEKEKKELRAKWETMDKDIGVARNGGMIINEDVTFWHEQASKLIEQNTKTNRNYFFGCCPNCIWRYGRGKELAGNVEEARRLKGIHFESIGHPSKLAGVEYHCSQDFIEFESRNLAHTKLMEALEDGRNYMVGLYGMGGTGKTTLVKKVGNKLKKEEVFNEVVFTTVSNDPDIRKLQNDIAGPLGLKLDEGDQLERAKRLCSRLTTGRQKVLVILDDVWNELNLEDVGIPSSDNHSSCRVLVTSRMLRVCTLMSCQKKIELQLLSEKDASILFEKKVGLKDSSPPKLRELAQQIASECKRLPIAINVIAKSLKDEPQEVWKDALKCLKEFKQLHIIDENLEVYRCFQLSYEKLKDEKAKKLFLLCSMFPEDYEIPSEDLIIFGKGLGLFGEVGLYEEVRIHMLRAKRKLLDCCLLLQGEKGHVKMHDLVRDAAHWIANNEIQVMMGSKMEAAVKRSTVKYLYFRNMNNFPIGLDCTKLEILISVGIDDGIANVKLPKAFFETTKNLRVLALDSRNRKYPKSKLDMRPYIKSLNNIQTLCLKLLELPNFSAVENLLMLDTLELKSCSMDELPNGIVELKKLRLLSLMGCKIGRSPFRVIGKLSQIQELYFSGNYPVDQTKWMINEEVFAYFHDKDSISPDQLQRYNISLGGIRYFDPNDSISRALSIENFDPSTSNATIKNMVQRAQALHLCNLQGVYSSVTSQLINEIRGDSDELIELGLHSFSKMECLIDTTNMFPMVKIFSELEYLNLSGMSDLRYIMKYEIEKDKKEEILQLESVFPKLRTLTIEDCKQIEFIIPVCIEWSATRQLEPTTSSELQRSNSECLPSFDTTLYVIRQSFMLHNVREMVISKCDKMKSLFSLSDTATMMLENLIIEKCNGLKHIITNDCTNNSSIFPRLRRLTIRGCDGLQHMLGQYHPKDQNHNIGICVDLPALKDIFLCSLPNFVSICPNNCQVMLQSFELSYVRKCPLLIVESMSYLKTCVGSPRLGDTAPKELQRSNVECSSSFDTAQLDGTALKSIEERSKVIVGKGPTIERTVSTPSSTESKLRRLSLNELKDGQSMSEPILQDQHQALGETKVAIEVSQETNIPLDDSIEAIVKEKIQEVPVLEDVMLATLLANLAPKNSLNGQLITVPLESTSIELVKKESSETTLTHQQPLEEMIPVVTGSMKDELATSLIYSEPGALPPHPSPSLVSKETLSESVLMGPWEVHGQEIAIEKDSISRTSSSEITFQISHSTEVPSSSASAPSQVFHPLPSITEAPGSSSLASKPTNQGKDLIDFRGVLKIDARHASLLEEAIEKYPQLWDWQKGLRPKYCKWGYKSLIDMLLFLNSKTPKAMDESSKEEFGKLYAELESFGFDKGWLASMHRRVMDVQVDNSKLKQLGDLESQESSLVQELRNVRVEMARIRDDLSKYNTVFGF